MSKHYFAKDGSYGDADRLVVIDTSNWTEDEWDTIDQAPDSERSKIALEFWTIDPDQLELKFGA